MALPHTYLDSHGDQPIDAATDSDQPAPRSRWRQIVLVLCGLTLAGLMACIVVRLHDAARHGPIYGPLSLTTLLYITANVTYFVALLVGPRKSSTRNLLLVILLVAAGMRASVWFSPMLPDGDYHRYMWDGAVTAAGHNPYRYSPQQVLHDPPVTDPGIRALAERGRATLLHVNNPELRTIYPPAAQALFAIAHRLAPFDLVGWRIVLLAFDSLAAVLVLSLLRSAQRPTAHLIVYAWNPLLIMETYCGGHVDLAAAALAVLAVWLLSREHVAAAAATLALASGVKLWPALLIFVILWPVRKEWRRLAVALAMFSGLLVLMAIPFASTLKSDDSGLIAYSKTWLANAGAYWPIRSLAFRVSNRLGGSVDGRVLARAAVAAALIAAAVWQARRTTFRADELCSRVATIVLLMLLLSPTLYPWYYLAVIPFAAPAPRPSLLAWTLLLPLSYLRLYGEVDQVSIMTFVIHAPVWLLLLVECVRHRTAAKKAPVTAYA